MLLDDQPKIRFIVVDFSLISGVDYSALETFLRIKRMVRERSTHLVFCGLSGVGRELVKSGIFRSDDEADYEGGSSHVHNLGTLNEALEWCENRLLATYYRKSERALRLREYFVIIEAVACCYSIFLRRNTKA